MQGNSTIKPILAVTGLAREARIAAGAGVHTVCGGGDPVRLTARLAALTAGRYRAVISFGIAGALDPALTSGAIVVATGIVADTGAWPVAPALTRVLTDRLGSFGAVAARVAGVDAPVMDPAAKRALRDKTGAAAVDMESHVAARFAAAAGLPMCALRVISDPADRSLPPIAAHALTADGRVDIRAVLAGIARDPGQIPLLMQTGRDAGAAFAALRRVRGLLGPGLGLGGADLG
jgi:adenosylhomocysteine nucleosidase